MADLNGAAARRAEKLAVVLLGLGGPDRPQAVRPFLFNLFNDPAIIPAPRPIRYLLAKWLAARRAPVATAIYARLGGGSPLLANTRAQAEALRRALADRQPADGREIAIFVAMRYWHPFSEEVALAVKAFAPGEVVVLALYPQFSTTTTGSAYTAWMRAAGQAGLHAPTRAPCCWPLAAGLVAAMADLIRPAYARAAGRGRPRVLFSAHGLPERIVAAGDPYQWQVERTAAAVAAALGHDLDWVVCYQSRVGPLAWIGPTTADEIARAGAVGLPVVVVPIAFVSEHSETLVELDIEYRAHAAARGVPHYERVPAVATHRAFIDGLADLVARALGEPPALGACGARLCPAEYRRCPAGGAPAEMEIR
ncbi:MAG: ferrochelatase [Pseudomonadota bacterium]